jgi:hypothetical protein
MILPAPQELFYIGLLVAVLYWSGLWPVVIKVLRELRGDRVEEPRSAPVPTRDLDLSFRLLGISSSSTWEEIEHAYRQKAKIHHPDRGGDEDTMRALNEAYSLIKRARGRA